jgi:hypothetical protein
MPQLAEKATRDIFQKNFFDDFKKVLGPGHAVRKFQDCDFR